MNSLLQQNKECYLCHTTQNLHKHHIYKGVYARDKSEQYGMWIWLCAEHHTGNRGVHNNPKLDKRLKEIGQEMFEEYFKSRYLFMQVFKQNYLWEREQECQD